MRIREFWTLDDEDRELIARLAPGVGEDPARVLAYLLLRSEIMEEPADELTLRIGTGLNRNAIRQAVDRLESAGVVRRTTVQSSTRGRPPSAWHTTEDTESVVRTLYREHAMMLLDRAHSHFEPVSSGSGESLSDELTLGLNWRPNALHLPFYTADLMNQYEEVGLDVEIEHYEGSYPALEAVSSGAVDVGLVGAATVLRARADGEPIVPIAVAYPRAMAVLYTVRERFGEPLTGVTQLRGRRIGMPTRSETRILGRLFLNQVALDEAVEIVDTAGEEQDALLSGEVDVVTGSFSDPRRLEQRGMSVDALVIADHFPIYGPTLVVHEERLNAQRSGLERFLAGTVAGWEAACRDPMPAAAHVGERSGSDPERVRETFESALSEFATNEAVAENGWGWQSKTTWTRLRGALEQGTLLTDPETV